jgi:hypothetical protein
LVFFTDRWTDGKPDREVSKRRGDKQNEEQIEGLANTSKMKRNTRTESSPEKIVSSD